MKSDTRKTYAVICSYALFGSWTLAQGAIIKRSVWHWKKPPWSLRYVDDRGRYECYQNHTRTRSLITQSWI